MKTKGPLCNWRKEPKHRGAGGRFIHAIDVCWRKQYCRRLFDDEMKALADDMERGFFAPIRNLRDDRGQAVNAPVRLIGEPKIIMRRGDPIVVEVEAEVFKPRP